MTLVVNEIHLLDGLNRTWLVAAADRRVTKIDGTFLGEYPKLFDIPYLTAAISYFGLATVDFPDGHTLAMWDLLPAFIRAQSCVARDLKTFALNLQTELHKSIPPNVLAEQRSGFQICGYRPDAIPEYWYLTNIREQEGYDVKELKPSYKAPAPHFLQRLAGEHGWDGTNPESVRVKAVATYCNGDFRAQRVVWDQLDKIFEHMWNFPDFKRPADPAEYKELVKFKFEFIGFLYKRWARHQLIGQHVDIRLWEGDALTGKVTEH